MNTSCASKNFTGCREVLQVRIEVVKGKPLRYPNEPGTSATIRLVPGTTAIGYMYENADHVLLDGVAVPLTQLKIRWRECDIEVFVGTLGCKPDDEKELFNDSDM